MGSSTQHLSFDHAATTQKVVALTFDADMTPRMSNELKGGKIASWYNQKVIATLRQERVRATKIVSNILVHVRPGSIVILHMHGGPNAPRTADALPDIIRRLRLRGYTFVKVSDLLSLSGSKD